MNNTRYWTNKSVITLASNSDPISTISDRANNLIYSFLESGGKGPPFNPFEIAEFRHIDVHPSDSVRDASITFREGRFVIEYNPNRSRGRINFSLAHEIVHTLFPDCKEEVRNRSLHTERKGDEWQLEMLCNIGASEILMPIGSFPDIGEEKLSVESLLELRKRFDVSFESLLLRFARLTDQSCWAFAASRPDANKPAYTIEYAIPSNRFLKGIPNGLRLPPDTVVSDCTAIGFTAVGTEEWKSSIGPLRVECVAVPAYPGHPFPRVVGFARPLKASRSQRMKPLFVRGDATKPRGNDRKILAFIVNDATPRWGAGFALALRRRSPHVQNDFIKWAENNPRQFDLGNLVIQDYSDDVLFAPMIAQRGYGSSSRPRIRYAALESCLQQLADEAISKQATVHMPKIGSGQAGGNWSLIIEMIERLLSSRGVNVVIYDLPGAKPPKSEQMSLLFSKS